MTRKPSVIPNKNAGVAQRRARRPTNYFPRDKALMCFLAGQGLSSPDIADRIGGSLSPCRVRGILSDLDIPLSKERPSMRRVVSVIDVPTWIALEAEAVRYGVSIADFSAEVLTTMVCDERLILRNLMEGCNE